MSVSPAPPKTEPHANQAAERPYDNGFGWLVFAGTMVLVLGAINVIEGIAAIDKSSFFIYGTQYVFGDLNTWGWVALCVGAVQLAVAAGLYLRNQVARWAGVLILGLNALAQLLMMPAYPFWSLSIFALDIVALYGLIVHGHRWQIARHA